jgi:hypothetical protein
MDYISFFKSQFMKVFYFLLFPFLIIAQGKRDYIWLLGGDKNSSIDSTYHGFQIDFNTKPRSIYRDNKTQVLFQNNASICDKDGNLLMYTAGCNISDRRFQAMPNGKINEGFVWDFRCKHADYVIPKLFLSWKKESRNI